MCEQFDKELDRTFDIRSADLIQKIEKLETERLILVANFFRVSEDPKIFSSLIAREKIILLETDEFTRNISEAEKHFRKTQIKSGKCHSNIAKSRSKIIFLKKSLHDFTQIVIKKLSIKENTTQKFQRNRNSMIFLNYIACQIKSLEKMSSIFDEKLAVTPINLGKLRESYTKFLNRLLDNTKKPHLAYLDFRIDKEVNGVNGFLQMKESQMTQSNVCNVKKNMLKYNLLDSKKEIEDLKSKKRCIFTEVKYLEVFLYRLRQAYSRKVRSTAEQVLHVVTG